MNQKHMVRARVIQAQRRSVEKYPGFDFQLDADQRVDLLLVRLVVRQGGFHDFKRQVVFIRQLGCGLPSALMRHIQRFHPQAGASEDRGGNARCPATVSDYWKEWVVVAGLQLGRL